MATKNSNNEWSNAAILYQEYQPPDWATMRFIADALSHWIFRGQRSADWPLATSFQRAATRASYPSERYTELEHEMLVTFRRRADHYLRDPPGQQRVIEWLSIIQHYGGPTRLLDFTRSVYAATFFAVEMAGDNDSPSAIWAVNYPWLQDLIRAVIDKLTRGSRDKNLRVLRELMQGRPERLCEQLCEFLIQSETTFPLVVPVDPYRMHERLAAQQGLFICQLDLKKTFEQNLFSVFMNADQIKAQTKPIDLGNPKNLERFKQVGAVIKFIIPGEMRKEILRDLARMNISNATLFPGLDGFTRSLHMMFEDHKEFFSPPKLKIVSGKRGRVPKPTKK